MPDRFDADTAALFVLGGHPQPQDPPGVGAIAPPRRAARGREKDQLFVCLGLRSRGTVTPERYAELMRLAGLTFFSNTGSVTAALRQALAAVNQQLLKHNLGEGAAGTPVQGGLICAALRGTDFYAVQGGPGLVLMAHGAVVERFPQTAGRPLGLSDQVEVQYFHTQVRPGDLFCLSTRAPAGWTGAALSGLGELATLSALAERLRSALGVEDLLALVGRVEPEGSTPLAAAPQPAARSGPAPVVVPQAGSRIRPAAPAIPSLSSLTAPLLGGLGSLARRRPAGAAPQPAAEKLPAPQPQPALAPAADARFGPALEQPPAPEAPPTLETSPVPEAPSTIPEAPALPGDTDWSSLLERAQRLGAAEPLPSIPVIEELPTAAEAQAQPAAAPRPSPQIPPGLRPQSARVQVNAAGQRARQGLRALARALGVTLSESARGVRLLLARMMPEGVLQKQGLFSVPTSVQIGIAVATPLLVVALAALVYIQRGRAEQFADAFSRAQLAVATGRASPDPLSARPHWDAALVWLAQAEALRPGDSGSAALRREAQGKLDELDWVTRLDYQPLVVGGLGRDAAISRIVLFNQDVYALDTARNQVLRVTPTANNTGYAVDLAFECAGGLVGQFTIGTLVDITLVPGPNVIGSDALVALDADGSLLYCAPGAAPLAAHPPVPGAGWIQPAGFQMYAESLYVLDRGAGQVWQFQSAGGVFDQPASAYFAAAAYDLAEVVDFSIAGGDLFLLWSDGRIANCTRPLSGEPAACTDRAQFLDSRPGRNSGERLADVSAPGRLVYDPPPEPSLFLLDRSSGSLYQLSLKLALVRQFRASAPLPAPITSMAFDAAKRIYASAGDNLYVAGRP